MIKSVNNYPVSQLFDIEAGVSYAIPHFQCDYTWSKNQCVMPIDDVEQNDPGYLLCWPILMNQVLRLFALTGEKPC